MTTLILELVMLPPPFHAIFGGAILTRAASGLCSTSPTGTKVNAATGLRQNGSSLSSQSCECDYKVSYSICLPILDDDGDFIIMNMPDDSKQLPHTPECLQPSRIIHQNPELSQRCINLLFLAAKVYGVPVPILVHNNSWCNEASTFWKDVLVQLDKSCVYDRSFSRFKQNTLIRHVVRGSAWLCYDFRSGSVPLANKIRSVLVRKNISNPPCGY